MWSSMFVRGLPPLKVKPCTVKQDASMPECNITRIHVRGSGREGVPPGAAAAPIFWPRGGTPPPAAAATSNFSSEGGYPPSQQQHQGRGEDGFPRYLHRTRNMFDSRSLSNSSGYHYKHAHISTHGRAPGEKLVPPTLVAFTPMGSATRNLLMSLLTQNPVIS